MKKKLLAIGLAAIMAIPAFSMPAYAEEEVTLTIWDWDETHGE